MRKLCSTAFFALSMVVVNARIAFLFSNLDILGGIPQILLEHLVSIMR